MAVDFRKPELEDRIINKAEELAEERCGREFGDLPPSLQQQIWMDAEEAVQSDEQTQADGLYEQMREARLFGNGNGHKPKAEREEHWADLELDRRLGK